MSDSLPMQVLVLVHYRSINKIAGEEIEDSGSDVVDIEGDSDTSDDDSDESDSDDNDDSDSNDSDSSDSDSSDSDSDDGSDDDAENGGQESSEEDDVAAVNPPLCNRHLSGIKDHSAIKTLKCLVIYPKMFPSACPL